MMKNMYGVRVIFGVWIPLIKPSSFIPDGTLSGRVNCKPTLMRGSTFCHPCRDCLGCETDFGGISGCSLRVSE